MTTHEGRPTWLSTGHAALECTGEALSWLLPLRALAWARLAHCDGCAKRCAPSVWPGHEALVLCATRRRVSS